MSFFHVVVQACEPGSSLPTTFEDACESLGRMPSLFIEPDGSFVWVSPPEEAVRWQLDGCLFDRAGRLLYVELKGTLSVANWERFLSAIGVREAEIEIQKVRVGETISGSAFRHELQRASKPDA